MSGSEYALDRRVKLLRRKLANARHTTDKLNGRSLRLTEEARSVTRQLGRSEAVETRLQVELFKLVGDK